MTTFASRLSPMLHLTRITTAFAVVANVWFVILWTRGIPQEAANASTIIRDKPLWLLLAGALIVAVGLFAFATALNDTLDLRRDRALNPQRPLPSGQLSLDGAVRIVAGSLILAILGAWILGQTPVITALAVAFAVITFNAAAKYIPSVGLLLLGLIYAAHMLIPNLALLFLWPVWLAMTHALIVAALVHRIAERRPRLDLPAILAAAVGWAIWTSALAWLQFQRTETLWPQWASQRSIIAIIALALAFAAIVWAKGKTAKASSPQRAATRVQRYGSLWLPLYAIAWTLTQGLVAEGLLLIALAAAGLLGMTLLREAFALVEEPPGFRL